MAVALHVAKYLRKFTGGRRRVVTDHSPSTVRYALETFCSTYSRVRDRMFNEQGEFRPLVRVFVGCENIRFAQGLATPLPGDCEIHVPPTKE